MPQVITYDESAERKVSSNHDFVDKAVNQLAAEKLHAGEVFTTTERLLARMTAISEVMMDQQVWLNRQLIEIEWSIKEAYDPNSPSLRRERDQLLEAIHTLANDVAAVRAYFIRDSDFPKSKFESEVEGAMYSALGRRSQNFGG